MFSPFCSDLFKYLLGAPWTLLKSFSHRVLYLFFMFVHIVSHAYNSLTTMPLGLLCFRWFCLNVMTFHMNKGLDPFK